MNTSIKLDSTFIENKYTKWYLSIITYAISAENKRIDGYFERHHIVPRCMGGLNSKTNIVKLTAKEHFICHLLLTKMSSNHKLGMALMRMMNVQNSKHIRYKPRASNIYAYAKRLASEAKTGANNPMFGKSSASMCIDFGERVSKGLKSSQVFRDSRKTADYRDKQSNNKSIDRAVVLISIKTNKIVGEWKNCNVLAKALNYTYSNIKNARRDDRPIGHSLSVFGKCKVVYKKDLDLSFPHLTQVSRVV